MRGAGTKRGFRAFLAACLLLASTISAAVAQAPPDESPALISADEVTYDENLGIVTASGNVEVSQNDRVLFADSVSYNLRTNVVSASGNVSLTEPTGEVIYADFVELTDDMREGFIRDIRVLLTDRSRLAAVSGLRTGGNRTVFRKTVFSPCELCREDPTRAPLWQLKAAEVEHDQEERVIRYRDAWMEFYGVPVFYTPYLEHPDPTVKRKSGFLSPTFGASEVLGTTYQQPYYWAIAENQDATVAPIVTTKQGVALAGEYRHLFRRGNVDLRASGTFFEREETDGTVDDNQFRGHVDGSARVDINRRWRGGLDLQRATDDTYLRVYNFSDERTLTSRAFVERFDGRDYFATNGFLYQGLRASDDQDVSPIVLPLAEYNLVGEPGRIGEKFRLSASLLALHRAEGRESRRLSTDIGWELPYIGPIGDLYNITARVQADGYWTDRVDPDTDLVNPADADDEELTGRIFPQLAVNWRYPWVRHGETMQHVIEPVAQAVLAPNGANPGEIPNEDSLDFEFDDTNLFSLNRFTGVDRVDPGTRFDYGLKWTLTRDDGGYGSMFLGQSYRLEEDDVFAEGSGLENNLSDIVGRILVRPVSDLDVLYRFRLDKDNLRARRSEFDVRAGPPALNLNLSYVFVDSATRADEFGDREELTWTLRSQLSRYWSVFGGQRRDLVANQTLENRVGVRYHDECFLIEAIAERTEFRDREIEPETAFFVNVVFKHLGGLTSDGGSAFGG